MSQPLIKDHLSSFRSLNHCLHGEAICNGCFNLSNVFGGWACCFEFNGVRFNWWMILCFVSHSLCNQGSIMYGFNRPNTYVPRFSVDRFTLNMKIGLTNLLLSLAPHGFSLAGVHISKSSEARWGASRCRWEVRWLSYACGPLALTIPAVDGVPRWRCTC